MSTSISASAFNRDIGRAKKAAHNGPVLVTDRGRPTHVLLSIEHYRALTQGQRSIADCLAMPEAAEIDLPLAPARDLAQHAEF